MQLLRIRIRLKWLKWSPNKLYVLLGVCFMFVLSCSGIFWKVLYVLNWKNVCSNEYWLVYCFFETITSFTISQYLCITQEHLSKFQLKYSKGGKLPGAKRRSRFFFASVYATIQTYLTFFTIPLQRNKRSLCKTLYIPLEIHKHV